ncbi:MAG: MFS transporter [Ferroplasma sp.]|uniref:MFS transporter n=1 Tax=Ferroplasma sp. TaxID=2591003 RepID=UPI0028161AD3|nr:MFS transporter [Ferroplasma sp.]WMT51094.1 MAG: MFS transporter [Ferroplasma sp.]
MVESRTYDDAALSGTHFKWTLIASLGDFLDAGMLAGTGITLLAIGTLLNFTTLEDGLPALITLLGAAFGALTFGRLGDKFGRKFIYQLDMLIYGASSILLAITGVFPSRIFNIVWAMVFYAMVGIAVGADVPTSWSLITEFSPKNYRGRLMSITTIMWYVGVLVELGIAIALYNTGMILFRTIWIFLGLLAFVSWILRRDLTESPRFDMMRGNKTDLEKSAKKLHINISEEENKKFTIKKYKELFRNYGWFMLLAWFLYLMWGIPASTYGEFFPYIFSSLHLVSLRDTYAFEAVYFGSAIVPGLVIFYYLSDRVGRVPLYLTSAVMAAISFFLLIYPPFLKNVYVLLISFLLFGIGQGLGIWPTTRLLSLEHFPTSLRNSGQGFVWFTMRFEAGIFGLFTPMIVAFGIGYIGWIAGIFFVMAFVVVLFLYMFKPEYVRTERKSLEETSRDEVL